MFRTYLKVLGASLYSTAVTDAVFASPRDQSHFSVRPELSNPLLTSLSQLSGLFLKYPSAIPLGSGRPADRFCDPEQAITLLPLYREYTEAKKPSSYRRMMSQYGSAAGLINEIIARHLEIDEGIKVKPEHIVVTVGFQEAVDICMKTLFGENDVLIVPDPVFTGITGAALLNKVELAPLTWDGAHFDPLQFDALLTSLRTKGKKPKALYVIPDFSNPSGASLPLQDRKLLLEWAHKNHILLIEDNPYNVFRYEGEKISTLKALDVHDSVIYIGTAAKTVYPALRIGYLVATQEVLTGDKSTALSTEFSKVKSFNTVNTPAMEQALFASILLKHDYSLIAYNQAQCDFNKKNLQQMLSALEEAFPTDVYPDVKWNRPQGGYFLVLHLPFYFGLVEMEECAEKYGVIVTPISMFSLSNAPRSDVRLSFTNVSPELICKGISKFAEYVKFRLEANKRHLADSAFVFKEAPTLRRETYLEPKGPVE